MADFSFLSDSDNEKAVEELLSQAADSAVLEQIAAINCSGFTDSGLPTQLETRFHKLKSFPSVAPKPNPIIRSHSAAFSEIKNPHKDDATTSDLKKEGFDENLESRVTLKLGKSKGVLGKDEIFIDSGKNSNGGNASKENVEPRNDFSPIKSSEFSPEYEDLWESKKTSGKKQRRKGVELKSPSGFSSSPSNYSTESLSPPQRSGCLWCSPKRVSKSKSKSSKGWESSRHFGKSAKGNELLGDFNSYLERNQQKLLKKAVEEEEKICREAEKIVKMAKQASARIEVSSIEDELSDTGSL